MEETTEVRLSRAPQTATRQETLNHPVTTVSLTDPLAWPRNNIPYFYPNITITLYAVDDANLSSILLNDTGMVTSFPVRGNSSSASVTITSMGLHTIWYYSIDQAGNREIAHVAMVGLAWPNLNDLLSLIANSNIQPSGVKNALSVKVEAVQDQDLHGLAALSNHVNALAGQHCLDKALADLILGIIVVINN